MEEAGICDRQWSKEQSTVMTYEELIDKLKTDEKAIVLLATYEQNLCFKLYSNMLRDGVNSEKIIKMCAETEKAEKAFREIEEDKKLVAEGLAKEPYRLKNGLKMFLPYYERGDLIQKIIYDTGTFFEESELNYIFNEFEEGLIKEKLAGKNALDIGANIGNHTLFMLKYSGASCIHSFEPIEPSFQLLESNVNINSYQDRVCLHNIALGAFGGSLQPANYEKDNVGGTGLKVGQNGNIRMTTLDALGIDDVAFIKIDVEGMEPDVLLGARETIKRFRPFVCIESFAANFHKVQQYFEEYGYKYVAVGNSGNYLFYPEG